MTPMDLELQDGRGRVRELAVRLTHGVADRGASCICVWAQKAANG